MDFSYAQSSFKYQKLIQKDIVIFFLDGGLTVRYASPNNDILGAAAGAFTHDVPVKMFMPGPAVAELQGFLESRGAETVIEYGFRLSESQSVAVRHYFFAARAGFGDGVALRSYVVPADKYTYGADAAVAEYETALLYIRAADNMPVALFTHDGRRIEYANKMLCTVLKCEPGDLPGLPLSALFAGGGQPPAAGRFSAPVTRKDGSVFAADIYVLAAEPEKTYIAALADTADYRSRDSADVIFRRVFEHSSHASALLDAQLGFTWVNGSFASLVGYAGDALVGQKLPMLYSDEHTPNFYKSIWEAASSAGAYRGTVWLRAGGGNLPTVLTAAAVKNENAEIVTYVLTLSRAPNTLKFSEAGKDTDELTGLYTKGYFEGRLEGRLADCRAGNGRCAAMVFDIDRLGTINEMYGKDSTDMLLQQVAQRLTKYLPEGTVAARDSDEFWALIEDKQALDGIDAFAEGLITAMSRTFHVSELEIELYISVAIVFCNDESSTKQAVFKHLAQSMAVPKLDWQSSYQVYMSKSAPGKRAGLEEDLRGAIIADEFVLYYFPTLDARTQKLIGLEALLRWQKPGVGLVAPGDFIAEAEGAGLMPALGEKVLNMACMQLQKWNRAGLKGFSLAINMSSLQLRDENLGESFIRIISGYGIDPGRIEFELTESFAFQESDITARTMGMLADVGVKFAIDDFGTGYSSYRLLKKYPISTIKIDRSFVKALPDDGDARQLVAAMTATAHSLGMTAVAEGVETMAQFEYMQESGCDAMQGFFIGRPAPAEEIEELIRSYEGM